MFTTLRALLQFLAFLSLYGSGNPADPSSFAVSVQASRFAPPDSALPPRPGAVVIRRVETTHPYVAITVDDFYTANYGNNVAIKMLAAANARHATLTLCPAGSGLVEYEKKYPEQARQIRALYSQGSYELCAHTYSHPIMPKLGIKGNIDAEVSEIQRGQAEETSFFGHAPSRIFRPPFGSWNQGTVQAASQAGYGRVLLWSVDSGDSEGPERPAAQLVKNVACVQPGDVILMHANRRSSAEALPMIIDLVRSRGLEPVSVTTLLASGRPVYSNNPLEMKHLWTCKR